MSWKIFLICSVMSLGGFTALAVVRAKAKNRSRVLTPINMMTVGVVLSAVLLYIPVLYTSYSELGGGIFEAIYDSVFSIFGLFGFGGKLGGLISSLSTVEPVVYNCYIAMFSVIFVLAPMLTVGYVLAFFNDISAYLQYIFNYKTSTFVFSELNESSYLLAKSITEGSAEPRFIIFADSVKNRKQKDQLLDSARMLGAVCFRRSVTELKLSSHSKESEIKLFAMDNNEESNEDVALQLMGKYNSCENMTLYVFSEDESAEFLFGKAYGKDFKLKVRRVDTVRSLVSRHFYENGYERLFLSAAENKGVKHINAVVVGMGAFGAEVTRALPWLCQMTGYEVSINAVDARADADSRFCALCPELAAMSGNGIPGESHYTLDIHSGIDPMSLEMHKLIDRLPPATYIFVDMGDDRKSIRVAVELRSLYARRNNYPVVDAVVRDPNKIAALEGITNYRRQQYNINFIGDICSCFSERVILDSELEEMALRRHLKWGDESDFWRFDYNYSSSIASVIHRRLKEQCGIPGVEKAPDERTEQEKQGLRILEHQRWNAYVRSQGYVYGGTVEKSGRNDMAKTHNCLVGFFELPLEEQIKDDD